MKLAPRTRAILDELGVTLGWPRSAPIATQFIASSEHEKPATSRFLSQDQADHVPATQAATAPLAQPTTEAACPASDWPSWVRRVQSCQACALGHGRLQPVVVRTPPRAPVPWMVVGDPPDAAQAQAGTPFVGEAGALLDAMLRAVGASRDPAPGQLAAHLALALRCCPARPAAPDAQALAQCSAHLDAEIALLRPKVIVTMGRWAMRMLLRQSHPGDTPLVLARLRGQVWRYQGVPVVVTYPPAYLLTHPQDKARAWEDLKLARSVVQGA